MPPVRSKRGPLHRACVAPRPGAALAKESVARLTSVRDILTVLSLAQKNVASLGRLSWPQREHTEYEFEFCQPTIKMQASLKLTFPKIVLTTYLSNNSKSGVVHVCAEVEETKRPGTIAPFHTQ